MLLKNLKAFTKTRVLQWGPVARAKAGLVALITLADSYRIRTTYNRDLLVGSCCS